MDLMQTFFPLAPELTLLIMSCVILMISVFAKDKAHRTVYWLSQLTLITCAFFCAALIVRPITILFGAQYYVDTFATVIKFATSLVSLFVLLYSKDYIEDRHLPFGEYYVLSLLSIFGIFVLASAYSFITLFLGLEILSLPLYAMIALKRDKLVCIEASMKYFILGALASGLLLYGFSILYGYTANLNMGAVGIKILYESSQGLNQMAVLGLVFMVVGIAFKLGVVPFHMWVPDVYEGAPTSVTLLIASVPKIAGLALLLRVLAFMLPSMEVDWQPLLIVIAVLSMALGNFVAIVQSNIKRLLAYSSIAHMGYMLLGVLSATPNGYGAALFYVIVYALMTAGAFGIIIMMSHTGFEAETIDDFKGLNQRNPWLALMMLLIMFSMAGVPPIVGFFAKVAVLEALVKVNLIWLAALALLFAIVGAYYYLKIVKVMYFDKAQDPTPISLPGSAQLAGITCNGFFVLVLGIFPGALFNICKSAFEMSGL